MKILFGGGLNEQQSPDINEAFKGSYNFDLKKDTNALIPRAPFDLGGTAPNAGDIRGFMQLVKRDDTETTLVQAGNVVYKWDGTTFSTITTGLGSTLYAKYGIVHNGRVWLFNVTCGTDTPHLMVASAFEDPTSYSTTQRAVTGTFSTGLEAFYMLTPDLRQINGVVKTLAGDLLISTVEGSLFKLSGTDAKTYAFLPFFPLSNAIGDEAMVSMGNDIIYMRHGGNIDSLVATQNYGDVAADDLSRWIVPTVKGLTTAIAIYDQYNQKVLFFISGKVLVLFKDILYGGNVVVQGGQYAKVSPWSVYTTLDSAGFNTNAAKYMRMPGTHTYTVYFGDTTGRVFDLNGTGVNGDAGSSDIQVIRKVRLIQESDGINFLRHTVRGNVQYRRLNQVSFSVEFDWSDEYGSSTASVSLKGPPASDTGAFYGGPVYYGGAFYYGQGFAYADKISHQNFSIVGRGSGAFITCSSLSSKKYQVDNIELL